MSWDALGAIAELLGALAVLVTLLYLARQIRESARAQTLATYNALIDGYMRMNEWIADNPSRAELVSLVIEDDGRQLTPVESFQLNVILRNLANHLLRMLRLYEAGTIKEQDWRNFAGEARQIFNSTRYGIDFKANNFAFADLWAHLEALQPATISEFKSLPANKEQR